METWVQIRRGKGRCTYIRGSKNKKGKSYVEAEAEAEASACNGRSPLV
jgi:hypothetical protein